MDETLKLELQAIDRLDALDKMLDKLNNIDKSIAGINSALGKLDKLTPFIKLSAQINIAKSALGAFKSVLGGVVGIIEKGFDVGKNLFTQVLDAAEYKQNTLATLETFLGSREKANEEFNKVLNIAKQTPADTKELVDLTKTLYVAGFKTDEVETLRGVGADVQALFGSNEKLKEFGAVVSKIKGQGKLTGEVRESLSLVGIGSEGLNKQLGILLKIKGTEEQVTKEVLRRQAAGTIGANVGLKAAIATLKSKLGEKLVGEFAVKAASSSISGAVSNFKNAISDTFLGLDFDNSPGLAGLRSFLNSVTDAIGSPEFKAALGELAEGLFSGFKDIQKSDVISFFRNTAIPAILAFRDALKDAWKFLDNILHAKSIADVGLAALKGLKDVLYYIGLVLGKAIKAALFSSVDSDYEIQKLETYAQNAENMKKIKTKPSPFADQKPEVKYTDIFPKGDTNNIHVEVHAPGDADPKTTAKLTSEALVNALNSNKAARTAARSKGLSR